MGQNREAAAPWGVNVYHIYSLSFGLGTAALALIGAAMTLSCFLVALGGTFSPSISGISTLNGPWGWGSQWRLLSWEWWAAGRRFMLVVLFLPNGINDPLARVIRPLEARICKKGKDATGSPSRTVDQEGRNR